MARKSIGYEKMLEIKDEHEYKQFSQSQINCAQIPFGVYINISSFETEHSLIEDYSYTREFDIVLLMKK